MIPFFACEYLTTKNGFEQHKCDKYGSKYYFFLFAIGMVVLGVLYNLLLIYIIMMRKISYRQKDHDGFIKRKELEYVLEISDSWRKQSFFLFSSFKGSKARLYFKPVYNLYCLALISVHAFLGSMIYTKAIIFSVMMTVAAIFMLAVRPFRCQTSNYLLFTQFAHLCGPLYFVTQILSGLEHGLLVNTYFTIVLYLMMSVSLAAQIFIVVISLSCKAKWPMNKKNLESVVYRHERVLEMMQQAFTVITKLRLKK
jgi:MFS family permease